MTALLVGLKGDKEELSRLKHIFMLLDKDQDGYLSYKEVQNADQEINAQGLGSRWKTML